MSAVAAVGIAVVVVVGGLVWLNRHLNEVQDTEPMDDDLPCREDSLTD